MQYYAGNQSHRRMGCVMMYVVFSKSIACLCCQVPRCPPYRQSSARSLQTGLTTSTTTHAQPLQSNPLPSPLITDTDSLWVHRFLGTWKPAVSDPLEAFRPPSLACNGQKHFDTVPESGPEYDFRPIASHPLCSEKVSTSSRILWGCLLVS